jgi:hypothetical protein
MRGARLDLTKRRTPSKSSAGLIFDETDQYFTRSKRHFSRIPNGGMTIVPVLSMSQGVINPTGLALLRAKEMKPNNSDICPTVTETRAQRFRARSRQLHETARTMISEVDRRDLEWVADRYEMLASSAEPLEGAGQPSFQIPAKAMLPTPSLLPWTRPQRIRR